MYIQLARICWEHSASCFIYNFVFQVWVKGHCVAKILHVIWETFLYKNSYDFRFVISYETRSKINFLGGWWSSNEKYFCSLFVESRAILQRYAEFNRLLYRNIVKQIYSIVSEFNKDSTNLCSNLRRKGKNMPQLRNRLVKNK